MSRANTYAGTGLESLERRQLLSWGHYPKLIDQNLADLSFPAVTGEGVNIALVDSGVDFNHPNLLGKFWTNPREVAGDNLDNDGDGYTDNVRGWDFYRQDNTPEDENGHGTAMAGILSADPFSFGGYTYAGIARGAKIIPLKVSDPIGAHSAGFDQRVERALQWVEANHRRYGIRVVSMSIHSAEASFKSTYADELARLVRAGVFVATASGEGDPNANITFPGRDPNAFSVQVVNADDTISEIATRGPELDMLAPGDGVPILLRGGGYGRSGEAASYATPFAAGAAALLFQVNPGLTGVQVGATLKNSGAPVYDRLSELTFRRLDLDDALTLAGAGPVVRQSPYRGVPFATNMKIQAEHFDLGGEGVAYHDAEAANLAGALRTGEGVDVEPTADKWGGHDMTLARAGDWAEYTVDVAASGWYAVNARVASKSRGGSFHVEFDGADRTGAVGVPKTGSWQTWLAISAPAPVQLSAGRHVMRVVMHGDNATGNGAGNFNWFSLTPTAAPRGTMAPATVRRATAVTPLPESAAKELLSGTVGSPALL